MTAARTSSRRKMFWNVWVTDVVPAPDEPVIAMMGWRSDTSSPSVAEQAALGEQRVARLACQRFVVIALDALDLVARAEDQAHALVQRRRLHAQRRLAPGARAAAGLLHDEADRIRLVKQAQPPRHLGLARIARMKKD